MDIVVPALLLIAVCFVVSELLAMVLLIFFEAQIFAVFDATVGRLIDWLGD